MSYLNTVSKSHSFNIIMLMLKKQHGGMAIIKFIFGVAIFGIISILIIRYFVITILYGFLPFLKTPDY